MAACESWNVTNITDNISKNDVTYLKMTNILRVRCRVRYVECGMLRVSDQSVEVMCLLPTV